MKKRMWLWCLIAAFGLSFSVACSDDDEKEDVTPTPTQPVPPTQGDQQTPEDPAPSQSVIVVDTMDVTANIEEVPYTGGTITFTTTTNQDYTVASTADWITIDSDGRALTATYTVTATVAANEGEAREGKITVTFADEAATVKEVVVKQAAYVAPEQTPQTPVVPEPETETVTVTVEIYPGAAAGEVSAADVATKLGVADLAAAIADGSVTYVGLNADGTVYTAEDGSTPASTTLGVAGHWYNSECNPIVWGTPDPAGTGAVRLAFLEGDGATYTLGYDNSGAFAAGDSYTLAGKYIYGDAEVVFEVVINVVEAPASEFVAPEADYTIDIQVVQDNAWGATYVSLTGASISGWGAYSDPAKYVTPIADWSQDITPTIEAALGIEADGLEDALVSGAVVMGAYNNMNEFQDCYEVHSSNSFFWFAAEGSAEPSYGGMACIDQLSVTAEKANLTASTCLMPNGAVIGETYPTYIIFKTDDVEYVVLVNQTAVAAPEKVAMPEYTIVKEYEKTYEVAGALNHTTPDPVFTVQDIMPDIETLIEGTPDVFLFNAYDENLEPIFQDWSDTDGWFGADGATTWGGGSATFCLKPVADGTFSYCAPRNDGAAEGNIIIRYGNSTSVKAVDVKVKVIMSE